MNFVIIVRSLQVYVMLKDVAGEEISCFHYVFCDYSVLSNIFW